MTPPYDPESDEKERPSWREIDRRRDRSRHVSGEKTSKKEKSLRSSWAKQKYLKEVDKFFQGEKGGKKHKTALDAIHRHYGSGKFASVVKKYLKEYGMPEDWSTLMLLLDHKDEEVLVQTIEALRKIAPERSFVERQSFKDKLEILSFTASSSRITSLAERVLGEL